jgi:hypothetical protein
MAQDSASARIMWRPEHQPDMTKAELIALWPGTLFCDDFPVGVCCNGFCHQSLNHLICVYPESCYSVKSRTGKMPDIGFGLHGEVCCGKYEAVKQLPRSFWVELLCRRDGWSEAHIAELVSTPAEHYYRVRGQISDHYYALRNPSSCSRQVSVVGSPIRNATRRQARSTGTGVSVSKCSSCGMRWNGDVCDNCGHGGGI